MSERGATLTELLIAVALVATIAAGLLTFLMTGQRASLVSANHVDAQTSARLALERMVREVRAGGNDPTNAGFPAIVNQTTTGLTIQNDWDGNGVIDPVATTVVNGIPRGEQVTYSLVGSDLQRQESAIDAAPLVLTGGIQQLTLEYRGASDLVTGVSTAIRTVLITITASGTATDPQGKVAVTMVDRVRIRNR